ncbi:MAG: hypothetical protein OXT03_03395 [Alphaproteobacteria bacterium]|nr:hypothetical protein [Alphaproteobacteria bacterium]
MKSSKQKNSIRQNQSDSSSARAARRKRSNVETQLEIGRRIMREDHEVYKRLAE